MFRLLFYILVVFGLVFVYQNYGSSYLAESNPALKKEADDVLGKTTTIFQKQASRSANFVSGLVLKKATEPMIKEYEKLTPDQKEIIKKQICR